MDIQITAPLDLEPPTIAEDVTMSPAVSFF